MAAPVQVSPRQSVAQDTEQLAMSTLSFQDYVRERMLRRRSEEMSGRVASKTNCPPSHAKPAVDKCQQARCQAPAVVRHNPLRALARELPVRATPRRPAARQPALACWNELQVR